MRRGMWRWLGFGLALGLAWMLPYSRALAVPGPQPAPEVTPPVNVAAQCGAPDQLTFLAVGAHPSLRFGMGDAVRLVVVDFTRLRLVSVPLPRDLYVDLPWDAAYPSPIKLTSAYFLGTPWATQGGPLNGGVRLMAATIAYNFDITVDRYVAVSDGGFRAFINAIGGIPVDIPYRIYDRTSGADFTPGTHVLDGHEALALARARMDRPGFVRAERQGWVLQGILRSLAEPETLAQIPEIYEAFRSEAVTNLTLEDVLQLTCFYHYFLLQGRSPEMYGVPEDLVQGTMDWVFIGREPQVAYVAVWDEAYVRWLHEVLYGTP